MTNADNKKTVGLRIKQIRKELSLSAVEFANRLELSRSYLEEVESGKCYPNFDFLVKAAGKLNVNLYYLILGEGDMFTEPGKVKHTDMVLLEALSGSNRDIREFLYYFEKSQIMRYYLLSHCKHKLMLDKEMIEKEILENNKEE
jgi:transcriptional regulator with XRE-family HTH domain